MNADGAHRRQRRDGQRPSVTKRSITVAGHRTSVSIEEPFWHALVEIAATRQSSVAAVVATIDRERPPGTNLSAAVRLFVLDWYRTKTTGG